MDYKNKWRHVSINSLFLSPLIPDSIIEILPYPLDLDQINEPAITIIGLYNITQGKFLKQWNNNY